MADLIAQLEQLQKWHEYENGVISVEPTYHHQKAAAVIGEAIKALSNAPSAIERKGDFVTIQTGILPCRHGVVGYCEQCNLQDPYELGERKPYLCAAAPAPASEQAAIERIEEAMYETIPTYTREDAPHPNDIGRVNMRWADVSAMARAAVQCLNVQVAPAPAQTELDAIHTLAMNPQDTAPRVDDTFTLALLRQLLARIPGEAEPVQEAHIGPNAGNLSKYPSLTFRPEGWEPAKAAPRVEPVQEPVAKVVSLATGHDGRFYAIEPLVNEIRIGMELYAAPISAPPVEAGANQEVKEGEILKYLLSFPEDAASIFGEALKISDTYMTGPLQAAHIVGSVNEKIAELIAARKRLRSDMKREKDGG